jgi:G3E family GTPase
MAASAARCAMTCSPKNFGAHVPETEEYGIGSFIYRARRPFNPEKFNAFIKKTWPGLIRAKGHFWLATRPKWVGEFSLAGAIARVTAMGHWWAEIPKKHWPDHPEWKRMFERNWDKVWGDRRQELVFIGVDMDEAAIRAALDDCLAGEDDRFEPDAFLSRPDPFPV